MDDALNTVKLHQVVENQAKKLGCSLDSADQKYLDNLRSYFIQNMGGSEEGYLNELKLVGLQDKTFMHLNEVSLLYTKMYEKLYGKGSSGYPAAQQLQAYADTYSKDQGYKNFSEYLSKTGYMFAKHILLKTTDDNGNALSAEKKAEKKKTADKILTQLRASKDPLTLFDKLMQEYSEDTGLSTNPDGYMFTSGEMDETFEKTVKALKDNEISNVVEISYGYDIILRRPALEMMAENYGYEQLNKKVQEWQSGAKVEYTDAYKQINPQTYYTKMKEIYTASKAAEESAQPSSTGTAGASSSAESLPASASPAAGASAAPSSAASAAEDGGMGKS